MNIRPENFLTKQTMIHATSPLGNKQISAEAFKVLRI